MAVHAAVEGLGDLEAHRAAVAAAGERQGRIVGHEDDRTAALGWTGGPGAPVAELDVGTALVAAYVLSVALFTLTSHAIGEPEVADLASSPQKIADGKVWTLLSSAFLVDGPPVVQLVAVAILAAVLVHFRGSFVFWRAALAGHVAAAVADLRGRRRAAARRPPRPTDVVASPDYGISCVWAGGLGALAAGAWRARGSSPRAQGVVVLAVVLLTLLTIFSTGLAQIEHVLAFVLGALVIVVTDGAAARPTASRGSRTRWPRTPSLRRPDCSILLPSDRWKV